MSQSRPWVVLLPGSRWDDVAGTDRQLAVALGELVEVLWVDPPFPVQAALRPDSPRRSLHEVAAGVHRLQLLTTPGSSRPVLRGVSSALVDRQLSRELKRRSIEPDATILLSPRMSFEAWPKARRMLFVTDDWIVGARLMGLEESWVAERLARNLRAADVVAAVTPELLAGLQVPPTATSAVVPNGTTVLSGSLPLERTPLAGLVGQLNERLDLSILAELIRRELPLLVVGPLNASGETGAQIRALLDAPSVSWTGPVPSVDLVQHLTRMTVGITPYADTEFNRASFPLKTLEYLGAGLPVVSTDLPAARSLGSPDLRIAADAADFAQQVAGLLAQPLTGEGVERRRDFAGQHTWHRRAVQVLELLQVRAG